MNKDARRYLDEAVSALDHLVVQLAESDQHGMPKVAVEAIERAVASVRDARSALTERPDVVKPPEGSYRGPAAYVRRHKSMNRVSGD